MEAGGDKVGTVSRRRLQVENNLNGDEDKEEHFELTGGGSVVAGSVVLLWLVEGDVVLVPPGRPAGSRHEVGTVMIVGGMTQVVGKVVDEVAGEQACEQAGEGVHE